MHVRAKPSHEVEEIVHYALRQDCVEAQIWGWVPKNVCSIEGPQEHNGLHHSSFLTGIILEPPRLFLELPGRYQRALVRENPIVTKLQSSSVEHTLSCPYARS